MAVSTNCSNWPRDSAFAITPTWYDKSRSSVKYRYRQWWALRRRRRTNCFQSLRRRWLSIGRSEVLNVLEPLHHLHMFINLSPMVMGNMVRAQEGLGTRHRVVRIGLDLV